MMDPSTHFLPRKVVHARPSMKKGMCTEAMQQSKRSSRPENELTVECWNDRDLSTRIDRKRKDKLQSACTQESQTSSMSEF